MIYLYDHTAKELKDLFLRENWPSFRAIQVIDGLYRSRAKSGEEISTLPKEVKDALGPRYTFFSLKLETVEESRTSPTAKFLFRLEDGNCLESVALPNTKEQFTLCISSQVGCGLKCNFCASGILGFVRDLSVHEIIEQIMFIRKSGYQVSNIVFMGMGEPLLNFENVMKAVCIINDPQLINVGMRHITISTAGVIEGIRKLSETAGQARLSVSLHFPEDRLRSRFMPVNRANPLPLLMESLREYQKKTGRQIMFEYILFQGLNDDLASADRLVHLLKGLDCKVNLIPYNPVEGFDLASPAEAEVKRFQEHLLKKKIRVILRKRRGEDIRAACGQLRLYEMKNERDG